MAKDLAESLSETYVGKTFKNNNQKSPKYKHFYTIDEIRISQRGLYFLRIYRDRTSERVSIYDCMFDIEQAAQSQPKCKSTPHQHRNPRQLSFQFYSRQVK